MSIPEAVRDLAERYTAAWCSQQASRVAEHYAADGSLRVNDGPAAVGREAIAATAQSFMTAFPDMCVALDELRAEGDGYVYHWTLTGTNSGPGGTGKRVRISGYEEWALSEDGLLARSLGHFDAAEYARQLREGIE
jgi:uncharacterized protein (TIGR02246 family)